MSELIKVNKHIIIEDLDNPVPDNIAKADLSKDIVIAKEILDEAELDTRAGESNYSESSQESRSKDI